jgi:vacuolar-type H+-ATPase subunit F/Vma7
MAKDNFAVIGNKDKMLIFSLVGGDVFSPNGEKDTRAVLSKLLTNYNQIFITSDYARYVLDIIDDTRNNTYPIVTILPKDKDDTYGLDKISQEIVKTLGVELSLDDNMDNV